MHVAPELERYIVALVGATRDLGQFDAAWADYLLVGASPRASIALLRASSALAYLRGREYVVPDDILDIAPDVLRHRLVLGYAARAAGVDANAVVHKVLAGVAIP